LTAAPEIRRITAAHPESDSAKSLSVVEVAMSEDDDLKFKQLTYHASRIPALDALSAFVADGVDDPVVEAASEHAGFARWYPVNGGHKVLIPHEGGPYDSARFTIEKGVWDHEHCKRCGQTIEPMTLCWVSRRGPYVILCESCHGQIIGNENA